MDVPQAQPTRLCRCGVVFVFRQYSTPGLGCGTMGIESLYLLRDNLSEPTDRAAWHNVGRLTWEQKEVLTNRSVMASKVPKSACCMLMLSY